MKWFALVLLAAVTTPAFAQDDSPSAMVKHFMTDWHAGDAKALSELFMPGADFVSPTGTAAKGRAQIQAFYAGAFARGYAGSNGEGQIVSTDVLSSDLTLIDAQFTISGARDKDGTLRPEEKGILAAVLRKTANGWRIEALRENEGASAIVPLQ